MRDMPDAEVIVHHGLEGVVAFETEIAEPDKEGSALRYRGVDIEEIVGRALVEKVWGLLIDGAYEPGLTPAEPSLGYPGTTPEHTWRVPRWRRSAIRPATSLTPWKRTRRSTCRC